MNILFANYWDYATNSMNHIAPFANRLCELGHSCIVAVSENKASLSQAESALFQPATYEEVLSTPNHFPNGQPADILHVWTPRENVRRFVEQYCHRHPAPKIVVHLEDNEAHLLEGYYRTPIEQLAASDAPPPEFSEWEPRLSHPIRFPAFIALADGVTAVIDTLLETAPADRPAIELLPGIDASRFYPSAPDENLKRNLGLEPKHHVIAYTGGVTASNREDIRSLYLAVKLLNDEGHSFKLIKTGPDDPSLASSFAFDPASFLINLGNIPRAEVPAILSVADILIQPGKPDAFNRYRLPSKLAEFLAAGRPVITAAANIAHRMQDGVHCLILPTGSPREIADACIRILESPTLASSLADNGRAFAEATFNVDQSVSRLLELYKLVLLAPNSAWSALYRTQPDMALAARERSPRSPELETYLARAAAPQVPPLDPDQLRAELVQERARSQQLADKVARMTASASWRLTSPLRSLRRALLDKKSPPPSPALTPVPAPAQNPPPPPPTPPPQPPPAYRDYHDFCARLEPIVSEYCEHFASRLSEFAQPPLISIIMPVYNTDERWLSRAINSVIEQIYPHWQLCIADDASPAPHVRELLDRYQSLDERIHVIHRENNGHISAASNSALELAEGSFIALLDHDDELPSHALARIADAIVANPDANLLYSDEDKIDEDGRRSSPHFKSDWNPDLLLGQNFISHLGVYRKSEVEAVGGFRLGYEGAQDWDLALRITERCRPDEIVHIPEVLYHWRIIAGSTAADIGEKNYAHEAGGKAIRDSFIRNGIPARIEPVDRFYWRVRYSIPDTAPKAAIVIPTRDRLDLLQACVESIVSRTDYPNYQLVIADNGSQDSATHEYFETLRADGHLVVDSPGPFNFNAINNRAIAACDTDIVCLLNNDITVINSDWLDELVAQAHRLEIGAVGARLLYPHDHVQHAGVVLGIGGIASEAFKKIHKSDDGYIHRAHLVGNYSAVTGACMAFRKSVWEEVGGLRETDVPNAFGDIDFCLRIGQAGYRVLYTPFAQLYHHESASRGDDLDPAKVEAFKQAVSYMATTWSDVIDSDPFYNPNLTLSREDFTLTFPPRGYSTE